MKEMRALWHPTRARIFELLKSGPASRAELTAEAGAPLAAVAYHLRALRASGCIEHADSSGPDADDTMYEAS